MSALILLMIIGLIGLVLMAIPGLSHHGHGGMAHGALHTHAPLGGMHHVHGVHAPGDTVDSIASSGLSLLRWIPSPRIIFSLMTMSGAIGFGLQKSMHLTSGIAALLALIPALAIEKFVFTPLWNSMMQFEGIPSSPLEALTTHTAVAVTPFRNGKGIVSVERDGREVQFCAALPPDQAAEKIAVGDRLTVEQVDAEKETVVVSIR